MSISINSSDPNVWSGQPLDDSQQSEQTQQGKQTPQGKQTQQSQQGKQAQSAQQNRQTQQGQAAEQPKSIPTLTQVNHAQAADAPATPSGTRAASPAAISASEAKHLIGSRDNGLARPDDSTNARAFANMAADEQRGSPPDENRFKARQTLTSQKIEALSRQDRDRFGGMQTQGLGEYESATTASDRQKVEQVMARNVDAAVDAAYTKVMADPVHRDNGRRLEQEIQRDINNTEATMRSNPNPPADAQQRLQRLRDDLRRTQDANRDLDTRIGNKRRDMDEIPR
ncbi:hypothetical protein [Paraburkholderia sp.]|uniref:hypothetical protein n=1 Tax=Paraburkholderia sp. TaxID=1926495 RepID=UPI002387829F|nr:hypothetical protein [Paraburkholderia sp.]MDE1183577.1 hypothetical protein [Paraburkholderia sp.]